MSPLTATKPEFELKVTGKVTYWQASRLAQFPGFFHLFTSRRGGVSPAPFHSWNLGYSVADERANVSINRQMLQGLLPGHPDRLITARQVHGDRAVVVAFPPTDPPTGDALLTNRPGLPLMLQFADCIPVVGFDPITRSAAVIHAGWRGTAVSITAKAIATWCRSLGSRPKDLWLAIGPGIGRCCYHLPREAVERLMDTVPFLPPLEATGASPNREHPAVDLAEINRQQAIAAGVPPRQITPSSLCTACHPHLAFSHRRDGTATGRMAALVLLTDREGQDG